MFLKAVGQRSGDIAGEANDKQFTNQIDIVDWSWGMSAPSAVGGDRTGRVLMRELKIVKYADKASTALLAVLNRNELLSEVVLSVRKAGGASPLAYFQIKLAKARVVDYAVEPHTDASGAVLLQERLSFAYRSVTIDYTMQGAAGGGQGTSSFTGETGDN